MWFDCGAHKRLLRRGFIQGQLPARHAARLHEHLKHCGNCRAHYDDVMWMERVAVSAGQSATRPAPLEFTLWSAAVVQRSLGRETAGSAAWFPRWSLRLAGAAVAVVAIVALWWFFPADDRAGFAVRTGRTPALQVRALCELEDIQGAPLLRSMSADPGPGEVCACPDTGQVYFTARTTEPGYLYAFVLSADGSRTWLIPGPGANQPVAIRPAPGLEPLPVKLDASLRSGQQAVHAVFVLADRADLQGWIDQTVPDPSGANRLDERPATWHVVRRIEFETTGGKALR